MASLKIFKMKSFHRFIFLALVVVLVISGGEISAQRYSFNKWDRLVFRNNPPVSQRLFSQTDFNLGYGAHYLDQPYEIRRTGITTMLGYRYNRTIAFGMGAGLEYYNAGTLAPFFLEGQIYFDKLIRGSVKPFLTGAAGYLFQVSGIPTDIHVFGNPGAGLIIPMTYRSSLSVSVGLYTQWAVNVERYSFINAKIGLLFY
jgi:hypothetical protein